MQRERAFNWQHRPPRDLTQRGVERFSRVRLALSSALFLALTATAGSSWAAPEAAESPTRQAALLQKISEKADLYARFDGYLTATEGRLHFANNGSRFGFKASQQLAGGVELFAGAEWSFKLAADDRYNISENPNTGLGTLVSTKNNPFGTRLGLVGLDFGEYGALSLGKQWSVYYDITVWTDKFTVFGAIGGSTFNAGTDGGPTGTGRANDAVIYRVSLGPLRLGIQTQFTPDRQDVFDSFAGSASYDTGLGLSFGATYSRAFLDGLEEQIVGFDGTDAEAFSAGAIFRKRGWLVSAVNTWTRNHEMVITSEGTVAYNTLGAELFAGYTFDDRFMVYGGYDLALARHYDTRLVDPNFGANDILFGARYLFEPKMRSYAYVEGRTGDTIDANGNRASDAVMAGLRLFVSFAEAFAAKPGDT